MSTTRQTLPLSLANVKNQSIAPCAILSIILPILSVTLWIDLAAVQKQRTQYEAAAARIENSLLELKRKADPIPHLQREINFIYGLANEYELSGDFLKSLPNRLKRTNLNFLNYIFFDASGTTTYSRIQGDKYKTAWKHIFAVLAAVDQRKEPEATHAKPIFKSMFGNVDINELAYQKGSLIKVNLLGRPAYFYWNTFNKNSGNSLKDECTGGMIFWFSESVVVENLALKHAIKRLNAKADLNEGYALINVSNSNASYALQALSKRICIQPEILLKIATNLSKNFQNHKAIGNTFIWINSIDSDNLAIGASKISNATEFSAVIYFWGAVFAIAIVFYTKHGNYKGLIKANGKFLVLAACLIPSLIIFLMSLQYLTEHERAIEDNTFRTLLKHIDNIDNGFNSVIASLENLYRKTSNLNCIKNKDLISIEKLFWRLKKADLLEELFIVESSGKTVRFNADKKRLSETFDKLLPILARKLFQSKFNQDAKNIRTNFSELMFEDLANNVSDMVFGKTVQKLLADLNESEDKIIKLNLGKTTNFIFTHFSAAGNGIKQSHFVFLIHNLNGFAYRYLKRLVRKNALQPDSDSPIRLAVFANDDKGIYPHEYAKYPFIIESIQNVLATGKPSKAVGQIVDRNYLVAAAQLKNMPNYILITVSPMESLNSSNLKAALKLALLSLSIIMCIFVAGAYHASFLDSRST